MPTNFLTNEQKLDQIYSIIQQQDARNRRARWFHLFKWMVIFGITYFVATNPTVVLNKITAVMRPFIIENIKNMMDDTKTGFFDDMKKALQQDTQPL